PNTALQRPTATAAASSDQRFFTRRPARPRGRSRFLRGHGTRWLYGRPGAFPLRARILDRLEPDALGLDLDRAAVGEAQAQPETLRLGPLLDPVVSSFSRNDARHVRECGFELERSPRIAVGHSQ